MTIVAGPRKQLAFGEIEPRTSRGRGLALGDLTENVPCVITSNESIELSFDCGKAALLNLVIAQIAAEPHLNLVHAVIPHRIKYPVPTSIRYTYIQFS